MKVRIEPSKAKGKITAPPSKTAAVRMLICAGLADGTSTIRGISPSQDILAVIDCLTALGAKVDMKGDKDLQTVEVTGTDPRRAKSTFFECRESGSALRFFLPLCALSGEEMIFHGEGNLLSRSLGPYSKLFADNGVRFHKTIDSIELQGKLRGGEQVIDASESSQFTSGLLLALPLTGEDCRVRMRPPVASRPYLDMTAAAMERFGIKVIREDELTFFIPGGQSYKPADVRIEGDWSAAAVFLALGADVDGVDRNSLQGDRICTEYYRELDKGFAELDITDCPDLESILMVYAARKHGCILRRNGSLRAKESDRGSAMKDELEKLGVRVDVREDSITIDRGLKLSSHDLKGHDDHRIVMALSVMCALTGGTIEGAEAVSKSFPDFFERLEDAGVSLSFV